MGKKVTLLDLCISRKYKSGLNALLNHFKVPMTKEKRAEVSSILEEGSSVQSAFTNNGVSMAERTSNGSGGTRSYGLPQSEDKKVRKTNFSNKVQHFGRDFQMEHGSPNSQRNGTI